MLDNVILESNSILRRKITGLFLPKLHMQNNTDFMGSGNTMNPCETCLNCFYPRCFHGNCQELLKMGYGRGLQELESLNSECRHLLMLCICRECVEDVRAMDDDTFVTYVSEVLEKKENQSKSTTTFE